MLLTRDCIEIIEQENIFFYKLCIAAVCRTACNTLFCYYTSIYQRNELSCTKLRHNMGLVTADYRYSFGRK